MDNNHLTGKFSLDALINNGIPKGKLDMIKASTKLNESNSIVIFAPVKDVDNQYMVKMPITDVPEKILESGCQFIKETLDWLKENNFKIPNPPFVKYEKYGDSIFPVTYNEDGTITMDYPSNSLI